MTVHARVPELRIVDPDDDTVLSLAPIQGLWTEEQYLAMTDHSRIVNPLNDTITVLALEGASYTEHGSFHRGDQATSQLLAGFSVSVDAVFDAK